jgi:hypothetical protein
MQLLSAVPAQPCSATAISAASPANGGLAMAAAAVESGVQIPVQCNFGYRKAASLICDDGVVISTTGSTVCGRSTLMFIYF